MQKRTFQKQDTDNRFKKLEQTIELLEEQVTMLGQLNNLVENIQITRTDEVWSCEKCGNRLGIYDREKDELRVRYKDFFAWWKVGEQGELKIVCRSCSNINVLRYTNSDNK